jgi:homoserine kinase
LNSGALGCGISGSGPSVFALSKGAEIAKKVEETMKEVYSGSDIGFKTFISPINTKGIRIL